jgi:hypothetical protein
MYIPTIMKKLFIALIGLLMYMQLSAQSVKKIYAFWHVRHTGNIPKLPPVEEGDNGGGRQPRAETPPLQKSYYLYIECADAKAPVVSRVVFDGKIYNATVQKINTLPVEYEYFDGMKTDKITMVPKGRKNVYVVVLGEEKKDSLRMTERDYAVSIRYKTPKGEKLIQMKKAKELPPSVVQ